MHISNASRLHLPPSISEGVTGFGDGVCSGSAAISVVYGPDRWSTKVEDRSRSAAFRAGRSGFSPDARGRGGGSPAAGAWYGSPRPRRRAVSRRARRGAARRASRAPARVDCRPSPPPFSAGRRQASCCSEMTRQQVADMAKRPRHAVLRVRRRGVRRRGCRVSGGCDWSRCRVWWHRLRGDRGAVCRRRSRYPRCCAVGARRSVRPLRVRWAIRRRPRDRRGYDGNDRSHGRCRRSWCRRARCRRRRCVVGDRARCGGCEQDDREHAGASQKNRAVEARHRFERRVTTKELSPSIAPYLLSRWDPNPGNTTQR